MAATDYSEITAGTMYEVTATAVTGELLGLLDRAGTVYRTGPRSWRVVPVTGVEVAAVAGTESAGATVRTWREVITCTGCSQEATDEDGYSDCCNEPVTTNAVVLYL